MTHFRLSLFFKKRVRKLWHEAELTRYWNVSSYHEEVMQETNKHDNWYSSKFQEVCYDFLISYKENFRKAQKSFESFLKLRAFSTHFEFYIVECLQVATWTFWKLKLQNELAVIYHVNVNSNTSDEIHWNKIIRCDARNFSRNLIRCDCGEIKIFIIKLTVQCSTAKFILIIRTWPG